MAPAHRHPSNLPDPAAADLVRDAHRACQRAPRDGRDLPRFAKGRMDARLQRARVRARHPHAALVPGRRQPAQHRRGRPDPRRRRPGRQEAGRAVG